MTNTRPSSTAGVERGPSPPSFRAHPSCHHRAVPQKCQRLAPAFFSRIHIDRQEGLVIAALMLSPDHGISQVPAGDEGAEPRVQGNPPGWMPSSTLLGNGSDVEPSPCGPRYCTQSARNGITKRAVVARWARRDEEKRSRELERASKTWSRSNQPLRREFHHFGTGETNTWGNMAPASLGGTGELRDASWEAWPGEKKRRWSQDQRLAKLRLLTAGKSLTRSVSGLTPTTAKKETKPKQGQKRRGGLRDDLQREGQLGVFTTTGEALEGLDLVPR